MAKTTERHFEWFKQSVMKWAKKANIGGWQFYFDHCDCEDSYARLFVNYLGRNATFEFCLEWSGTKMRPLSKLEIDRCACHEVSELLIHPLYIIGISSFKTKDEIEAVREELAIRVQQILWEAR